VSNTGDLFGQRYASASSRYYEGERRERKERGEAGSIGEPAAEDPVQQWADREKRKRGGAEESVEVLGLRSPVVCACSPREEGGRKEGERMEDEASPPGTSSPSSVSVLHRRR